MSLRVDIVCYVDIEGEGDVAAGDLSSYVDSK